MIDSDTIREIRGISEKEAETKLRTEGFNELPSARKRNLFMLLFETIKEPMFLLLIACGLIYLLLGDVSEALLLLCFVFVVIGITFYQENRTERSLEALRDLSSPRAQVVRDGEQRRIPGREVVTDDIVVLSEGDRVPADAVVIACTNLLVDESILTGESIPVRKSEAEENKKDQVYAPGGDDIPYVYSGTLVVSGMGIARVMATGINTEMGKIGKTLSKLETEKTPLQKETASIVKNFALGGLLLCAVVVILYGTSRGNWLEGFLAGITLAMSILPEEFPVVLTVFLALGAWRMSRKNVLARRQHAIQALGSATVLCVDKTGTLTSNRMAVKQMYSKNRFFCVDNQKALPEKFHELVEFGILASQKEPFDPMEKALKEISNKFLSETDHIHSNWKIMQEYPLSKRLLAVSHVWMSPDRVKDGDGYIIAAKGSPESIGDLCHLNDAEMNGLNKSTLKMADNGLRVIGVARASMNESPLPDSQHDFEFEFVGLLGFEDPVRKNVSEALKECYDAGIRVVMITGDYPGTAKNIAMQIGLDNNGRIMTGPELDKIDDSELKKRIAGINIFARVVPEQKIRIVNALKKNNEIVAMTGDGVNDAPALKSAHIGIAMGARGTDVARESASVVLIDDNFFSIVQGVKMGRRIFDNIRKAMTYILAVHIPIAGITLLAVISGWPLILMPVHIVFLELIIDPACSIVFEAQREEKNVMKLPPRDPREKLFDRKTIVLSVIQGLVVLLIVAAMFKLALYANRTEFEARALAFAALILSNIGLILTNLAWTTTILSTIRTKNTALWVVAGGAMIFLAAVLYIPFLQEIFKFGTLGAADIMIVLAAGIFAILGFEILKIFFNRSIAYKKGAVHG